MTYTLETVLALDGRELDAAVAVEVMGWRWYARLRLGGDQLRSALFPYQPAPHWEEVRVLVLGIGTANCPTTARVTMPPPRCWPRLSDGVP
jgi:hypothetical protein